MIIADTTVVSESMRDTPDPGVLAWARTLAPADLTICVVTVEEIERGHGGWLSVRLPTCTTGVTHHRAAARRSP